MWSADRYLIDDDHEVVNYIILQNDIDKRFQDRLEITDQQASVLSLKGFARYPEISAPGNLTGQIICCWTGRAFGEGWTAPGGGVHPA